MSNNSVKVRAKKFASDMKAPAFNQLNILSDEVKDLEKNVKQLLYRNSDQKAQLIEDIRKLNNSVKQAREEEYAELAKNKISINRLQETVMFIFFTGLIFLGAFILALGVLS